MNNPSDELDTFNKEMKKLVEEIKIKISKNDQDGVCKLQQELNDLHLKWMMRLTDWLKNEPRLAG